MKLDGVFVENPSSSVRAAHYNDHHVNIERGMRMGPYEIDAAIGAGGMGEVYRATDTRLQRAVAIKVLPEGMSANPQRIARFQREAKTVSSLTHPALIGVRSSFFGGAT